MRLAPLDQAALTAVQREAMQEAMEGPRGHVPKPMLCWLSSPELARRAQHLGALVRYGTSLPPRLSELAILVIARHWSSAYEWQAHKKHALKAGLAEPVIADIAARRPPHFADRGEELVHDFCQTLLAKAVVPDALFAETKAQFGERGIADLLGLIGYYSMVALSLNAFECDLPEGQAPEISHDD